MGNNLTPIKIEKILLLLFLEKDESSKVGIKVLPA